MFLLRLTIQNKMSEIRALLSNFNIVGPLSLAVTIPWIMFKMFSAAWLKKGFNELVGKVSNYISVLNSTTLIPI